jgi:predicted metalloenzyme YecM
MMNLQDFYKESSLIVETFNAFLLAQELVERAAADHICYKCESSTSFETTRALLETESEYIFQSIISGRRIAIVRLKQGIETALGTIHFLELSDQKPVGTQSEGFDHIEVYPVGRTYEDMVSELEQSNNVIKVERPHHTTHDIALDGGFIFRCTREPLIEKIKRDELQ